MSTHKTFTVRYFDLSREHNFSIHKQGCADIAREGELAGGHTADVAGPDALAVVDAELASINEDFSDDPGYGRDSFKIHDCCKAV